LLRRRGLSLLLREKRRRDKQQKPGSQKERALPATALETG
jgi:hypothetical protein